ncbi:hypothetical protein EBU99_09450, partial [bacterium]|nr:hypothetical protein [bacterium]
ISSRRNVLAVWNQLGAWGHGMVYLALMLPFAIFRHVRIHGDEKVYVGQALEMLRAGHWWQQIQFGEVKYIKGPMHYLLLILGHKLFGFSMLSTVYMNFLLAALAVVGLRAAGNYLLERGHVLRSVPAWLFASSGAFVMFSFSSQMDSEVTSLYAIALSLSVLARHTNKNIFYALLWLTVGAAGTFKSPLHSCLLGVSVLAYFIASGEFFNGLLANPSRWLFVVAGVLFSGSGYLVPFVLDQQRWLGTYMFRETIDRQRFSDPASGFLLNNFIFHIFPWSILVCQAIWIAFQRIRNHNFKIDELTRVGLSFLLPTFLFFFGFGYLAPWYGLPMIPALVLLIVGQLAARPEPLKDIANALLPWVVVLMALVLVTHAVFYDSTPWWHGSSGVLLTVVLILSFVVLEAVATGKRLSAKAGVFVGAGLFWCSALGMTAILGEAELHDARMVLQSTSAPLNYNNIVKENYNEWGYMAYMLGQPSEFSNSFEDLVKAGRNGQWMVFTSKEELNSFWTWLSQSGLQNEFLGHVDIRLWRRWPRNVSQLREIWNQRSDTENLWDRSSRHFMLMRLTEPQSHVQR